MSPESPRSGVDGRLLQLSALPREAAIELTSRCPFDCVFCTRRDTRGKGRHMEWATYASILRQLGQPQRLYLNCVGESVHYPRIGEAVRLAKSTGAAVELTSAMGTAPDEVLRELAEARLDNLHVSLHALDADLYREIYRGGATASLTREKIERFLELRDAVGGTTAVDFAFVALEQNLSSLSAVADYAHRLGIRRIGVIAVMQPSERRHLFPMEIEGNYLSPAFRAALASALESARRARPEIYFDAPNLTDPCELDAEPREFPWPLPPGGMIADCYESPFQRITILANGDVPACCEDGMEVIGNVANGRLQEIWRGSPMNEFRRRHLLGEHPTCRVCPGKRAYLPNATLVPLRSAGAGRSG